MARRASLGVLLVASAVALLSCARGPRPIESLPEAAMNEKSPKRVEEVLGGKRDVANAAWWGFDEHDATDALQAAVRSGARTLIVPDLGKPWILSRTLELASDQEILFQRGAVLEAMRGKFLGRGEPLVLATNQRNLTLRGYGATFRMHKPDYTQPPYEKAEWRHALSIRGCTSVQVLGLTLRDSGGDGIYLGTTAEQPFNKDVLIQDVTCDNNHRQGISVITAENLVIENCRLLNTRGTAPQAGIDLEPNRPDERLASIVIRNCLVEGNAGPGIYAYLAHLRSDSQPISIRVEGCALRQCGAFGIGGGAVGDNGPGGVFEFRDCVVDGAQGPGAYVYDKAAERAAFRFVRCTWQNVARKHGSPIVLALRRPQMTERLGGIEFVDCTVEDEQDRAFLVASDQAPKLGLSDVKGTLTVKNPHGARMELGTRREGVDIRVKRSTGTATGGDHGLADQ